MADPIVVRTVVDWPMDGGMYDADLAVELVRRMVAGADPGLVASAVVRYAGVPDAEPLPDAGVPIDLQADGVLFMLNVVLFHPRGFALAVDREVLDAEAGTWRERLVLLGDGSERWVFAENGPESADNDSKWEAFNALLARAVEANATPAAL